MRVLVTGGAGFIGSNLVRTLEQHPEITSIRVIDDYSTGNIRNLDGTSCDRVEGSILDEASLDEAIQGVESIVHLAAIPSVPRSIADPVATHNANATGTLRVLEAARRHKVEQVIVASSSSVYGSNPELPKSEFHWTRPMSPYAVSKQATEDYAIAYQHAFGLKTLAFRFFNVYGRAQAADHAYAAVIPKFISAILEQEPLTVYGDGTQSRDFTHVSFVTSVITQAIVRKISDSHPVNLAFGTNATLLDLISLLEEIIGSRADVRFASPRPGDVKASQANSERLRALFPDVAPPTLRQGLEDTVEWYRGLAGARQATGSEHA